MERGCKGTGSVRKTEALCLHLAHSLMFTEARQVKVAPAALYRRQAERQCPLPPVAPPAPSAQLGSGAGAAEPMAEESAPVRSREGAPLLPVHAARLHFEAVL